ncbi:MAG: CGNR zinc finger domain-containing protein [Microbacteriaceae bacterium]|nr:CGNR zinc finger domain-containing protein [Microbacteriaceae bacterium]
MRPPGGSAWHFDAGAESLDFAYTGELAGSAGGGELLRTAADLGAWLAERVPRLDAAEVTERDLPDALGLRDALARLYTARADDSGPDPDDVDTLNLFAAMPDIPPSLGGGRRQAGAGRIRVGQALSSLAREAVAILGEQAADGEVRVRRCAADDCRLVFRDESRTNNRRWCSMERCGNRAKVRAHRERAAMRRLRERGGHVADSGGSEA